MIAAIGALSGGSTVGSESADYVARLAELRRQLAAIQRKLAEAAKGGAGELNMVTQQWLAQQATALQAQIAVLQLPHVNLPHVPFAAPPVAAPAAPASQSLTSHTGGSHVEHVAPAHQSPDALTYDPYVGGLVDREA